MSKIGEIFVKFTAKTKGLDQGIDRSERKMKSFGGTVKKLAGSLAGMFAVGMVARWGTQVVKSVIEIEASFMKLETLVGLTNDQVEGMKDNIEALSKVSGRGTQELVDALFTITSAGLRGAESLEVLERSAKASAIGLGDTKSIAKATTAVIQAYGKETMSAARATDILTAIVREGNLEASELAPTLGRVVGMAAQLGVSFEEVGANIATFTRLGVDSTEAVVGLRGVMAALLKPTKMGKDALAEVGLTFAGLRGEIQDKGLASMLNHLVDAFKGNDEALSMVIPNVRALSSVLGTAGAQGAEYTKIMESISASMGIVDEGFEKVGQTAKQQLGIAINNLKLSFEKMGNAILPIIIGVVNVITKTIDIVKKIPSPVKVAVISFTALRIVLGLIANNFMRVISFIPKMIAGIKAMTLAMAKNPLGLLLIALSAVGAALITFVTRTKKAEKADKDFESQIDKTNAALARREKSLQGLKDSLSKLTTKELKNHLSALEKESKKQKELYEGKTILNQATLDSIQALSDEIGIVKELIKLRGNETVQNADLLVQKEKELELATLMAGGTEKEIAARNRKIAGIELEIKRLKELGTLRVEEKTKETKELEVGISGEAGLVDANERYANVDETLQGLKKSFLELSEGAEAFGESMMQSLGQSEAGIKGFAGEYANMARKIIRIQLAQSIASAVESALVSVPPPFNLLLAAGAGGAAAALFNSIVPSFAQGGFVPSPTLAMIGDAPGGEYVLNQGQMKSLTQGGSQELHARIGFDAIYLANKKHTDFLNRTT